MKRITRTATVVTAVLLMKLSPASSQATSSVLKLGEPAPPLQSSEWLQGKKITGFEKGKIYVVEFWATWCVYCIKAMPHLSELAEKYKGKMVFIGADVLERVPWGQKASEYNNTVIKKFITTGQGNTMKYNVCCDTYDGYLAKNWVSFENDLFGHTGIPFTVVVNQEGLVAWAGNPADTSFEPTLVKILNNNYVINDFKREAAQKLKQLQDYNAAQDSKRAALLKAPELAPMNAAMDKGEYALAIEECYRGIGTNQKLHSVSGFARMDAFKNLLNSNPEKAYELIQLEKDYVKSSGDTVTFYLKDIASIIGRKEGLPVKLYAFTVETLKNEPEERVLTIRYIDALAMAYYYTGNSKMAIAVKMYKLGRTKQNGDNPAADEALIELFKKGKQS